jgi:adenosylhomocysteine nucleosidase
MCEAMGMNRAVLIISALPAELAVLRESMVDSEEIDVAEHEFQRGRIGTHDVVTTEAGIGKVNAAMIATLAIDHFHPGVIVVTGVAGSIDETLRIGDVVVAEHVLHHDTGVHDSDGFQNYQSGHVPFFNPTERFGYRPSDELLSRLRRRLGGFELSPVLGRQPRVVFGTVATGDQFLESDVERRRLHTTLGAHVVEMESAAVAQIAEHFGVDHLVIRAVSDLAGSDAAFDFDRFLDDVSVNSGKVVLAVLAVI